MCTSSKLTFLWLLSFNLPYLLVSLFDSWLCLLPGYNPAYLYYDFPDKSSSSSISSHLFSRVVVVCFKVVTSLCISKLNFPSLIPNPGFPIFSCQHLLCFRLSVIICSSNLLSFSIFIQIQTFARDFKFYKSDWNWYMEANWCQLRIWTNYGEISSDTHCEYFLTLPPFRSTFQWFITLQHYSLRCNFPGCMSASG